MFALAVGYPLSIAVIVRFVPVVRQQRWRWLVVHHVGVAAIVAGWSLRGETSAVAVNGAWLVVSSLWYALGGRSRAG
jgi:hypothetical protein